MHSLSLDNEIDLSNEEVFPIHRCFEPVDSMVQDVCGHVISKDVNYSDSSQYDYRQKNIQNNKNSSINDCILLSPIFHCFVRIVASAPPNFL